MPPEKGRRFNGRPAVSKTASGGSNPSAPAIKKTMPVKEMNDPKAPESKGFLESMKEWPEITKNYISELQLEMKRVTWPNRKQVEGTTAIVIITVFAFAAYFKVVDSVLERVIPGVQHIFTK